MEEDEAAGDKGALNAAIRSAKKSAKPLKIGAEVKSVQRQKIKPKSKNLLSRRGDAFQDDLGQKIRRSEGFRAKKTDAPASGKRHKGH